MLRGLKVDNDQSASSALGGKGQVSAGPDLQRGAQRDGQVCVPGAGRQSRTEPLLARHGGLYSSPAPPGSSPIIPPQACAPATRPAPGQGGSSLPSCLCCQGPPAAWADFPAALSPTTAAPLLPGPPLPRPPLAEAGLLTCAGLSSLGTRVLPRLSHFPAGQLWAGPHLQTPRFPCPQHELGAVRASSCCTQDSEAQSTSNRLFQEASPDCPRGQSWLSFSPSPHPPNPGSPEGQTCWPRQRE